MCPSARGIFVATKSTDSCDMPPRKCELLRRVFRMQSWGLNTNPNYPRSRKWLSPGRGPGSHSLHKLRLKLGQNFPRLNREEEKKGRKCKKCSPFPKSTARQLPLHSSPEICCQTKRDLTRRMDLLRARTGHSFQHQSCEWLHSLSKPLLPFGLSRVCHCLQNCLSRFMYLTGSWR